MTPVKLFGPAHAKVLIGEQWTAIGAKAWPSLLRRCDNKTNPSSIDKVTPMERTASSRAAPFGAQTPHGPLSDAPRMMDMSKVTTPILLHLLQAEFTFPRLFLLRCRLTVGRFKKTIDPKFPDELIDLAALPLWVYLNLKRKIGEGKAFEIMRAAILTGGVAHWNLAYRATEKKRTFENLCNAEIDVN